MSAPVRDWMIVSADVVQSPVVTDTIARFAENRGLKADDLRGRSLDPGVCAARGELVWLLRASTKLSYPAIGRILGGRHHTTIITAEERFVSGAGLTQRMTLRGQRGRFVSDARTA